MREAKCLPKQFWNSECNLLNFRQCLFKLNSEQNTRKGHGNDIGNGLCHVDAGGWIGNHMRHQVNQWKQQDKFPDDSHNDGVDCFSKGGKGHLAGNLDAEKAQASEVNAECRCGESDQVGVGSEDADKYLRNQLHGKPQENGIGQADTQQQMEGFLHAVCIFRTVIVTGNRLRALCNSLKRKHGELHDTGQDRHGSDCNITAVTEQGRVEAHSNDALTSLHDKSGKSQENTGKDHTSLQTQISFADVELCFFAAEEQNHPYAGNSLGKYRCKGSTLYAHVKSEDEYRVQNDIADSADQDRNHGNGGKSLCGDKCIHTKSQLHEQRSECIDVHIIRRIGNGISACAEGQQQGPVEFKKDQGQQDRDHDLKGKAVAQDVFCCFLIFSSHKNRGFRCAAGTDQCGKGRHDHDNRHTDTDACQGKTSFAGNVSDVNTVHNVVKHVNELCDDSGDGKPE